MKKTLLSALKHGSGTIFILLAMMLGESMQAWGYSKDQVVYYDNSRTKWSNVYFAVGKVNTQCGASQSESTCNYLMSNVPGTYLYKYTVPDNDWWSTAGEYAFLYNTSSWGYSNNETVGFRIKGVGNGYGTWPEGCSFTSGQIYQSKSTTSRYASTVDLYKLESTTKSYSDTYRVTILPASDATITVSYTDESGTSQSFTSGYADVRLTCKLTITASAGSVTVYGDYRTIDSKYVVDGNLSVCIVPTVTTTSAPDPSGSTTATLKGSYTTSGVSTPVAKGIAYKASGAAEYTLEEDDASSSGDISVDLTGLSPLTTYYYKAYVEISGSRYVYGDEYSFTTDCQSGITVTGPSGTGEGPRCFGESFTALSVSPSGASGYTYQWYYNTTISTTEGSIAISGATSASYTPAVVGANYYYCVVGATGYCNVNSSYSGLTTINAKPTLSVSESSVTNYAPVTVTAKGADIATWSVDIPANNSDRYLYKKTASSAKFKAKVNASATYTITGTTANSCSNTATVTVTTDSQDCH